MTNVSGYPKKVKIRKRLLQIAVDTLEKEGWKVERIPRSGKSSVRRITRGTESHVIAIRTSQDAHIAFPRKTKGQGWATLDEVDLVVAASVDSRENPREARVHLIPGDEMRERFNRAYKARQEAGHTLPVGRGIWLPLYLPDSDVPTSQVGGGAGLKHPPIACVPLTAEETAVAGQAGAAGDNGDEADDEGPEPKAPSAAGLGDTTGPGGPGASGSSAGGEDRPLTIPEAKRLLALTLGVAPENIKITVEA